MADGANVIFQNGQNTDKYSGEAVSFHEVDDHYELTFTGEFGSFGRDNHVFTDLINDLKNGDKSLELHIFISSVGGDTETLAAIMQQVLQYRQRVTIGSGLCCSAGFFLWATGNEKYISRYSELMYHSPSCCYEAKVSELNDFSAHMNKLTEGLIDAAHIRDLIPESDIERGKTTEVWYTGSDFIDSGKAKDYDEYKDRESPNMALIYEAGGRLFVKWPHDYKELHLYKDRVDDIYTYSQLVAMQMGEFEESLSESEDE